MNGGKSKKQLKALLRKNASSALFPILGDLGIQAALTDRAALALHHNTRKAGKGIQVVVRHKDELTIEGLCTAVASHAGDGHHFKINEKKNYQLNYTSADPETQGQICRVIFVQSGGPFPTILEDFNEIIHISEIPVLPVHAILLEQVIARSRVAVPRPLEKAVANFIHKCLLASGGTPLPQLSPMWQSAEILDVITQHARKVPGDIEHWITCGIDPSIFALSPSQRVLAKGADGPVVDQGPNVAPIEGSDQERRVVTEIVAREVVAILEELGFECAILGSAASQLYSHGETRVPEQLDVLILPTAPFTNRQGWLKQQIFRRDPTQFEWNSKSRSLSYKFQPDVVLPSRFQSDQRCKVEILIPGTASLASSDIVWIDSLPVIPFLALLLSKLQTWGNDSRRVTARDVKNLLSLAPTLPVSQFRPWRERNLMSNESQAASQVRVERFCSTFPETKPTWEMLGFDVENTITT